MKDWQRIRFERDDLTDYVIHFTRAAFMSDDWPGGYGNDFEVFCKILREGAIRPTFGPFPTIRVGPPKFITVRGPWPAVCLTEQPLSAVVKTRSCLSNRYSGFGFAYHKHDLFNFGARPVIYASRDILGTKLKPDHPDYQEGKDIFEGGLPASLQYLFVQYAPEINDQLYPKDFTWEREWRYCCDRRGALPVFLSNRSLDYYPHLPISALIVERDEHVGDVLCILADIAAAGERWAPFTPVISLETASAMLGQGQTDYARIETWPDHSTLNNL